MTSDLIMAPKDRIYCALDSVNVDDVVSLATRLKGHVGGIKLGLEFYCANGAEGYKHVAATGMPIFLDLKFHDIPNTVAGAIRAVAPLGPKILTIHTQGGPEMMRRASETAAEQAEKYGLTKPLIAGVTILTSLDHADMLSIGVQDRVSDQVKRLATLAHGNGLDGMVCSPMEITIARQATDNEFQLVVPGIRPMGSAKGDQKRVMTPAEAVEAGANILVIGRPITQAKDPVAAAKAIAASLVSD
ncbi:orotidine-5'-phosphate decarboxylase [Temperatibacter marinus]|uniref:Orotidine 5'-phosphate decarboxylase n=1 Tax=Temperatibacter marinus TaxID=1456591 RepID=A0AA52EGP2_9PROT|nr:orotidine-5'-phosphate decarboxylase [Temperatibacter marinus]WND03328.1 orotidine-5'-phosphate decarboxylase [Temperatibacter marinus]